MKKLLLFTVVMLFGAGLAFGQAGSIGLFADAGGSSCSLDEGTAVSFIYVIHVLTPGATASEFMVASSAGFNMIYIAEVYFKPVNIGDLRTGISIGYGSCFQSPTLLARMDYVVSPLATDPCSYLEIVPSPASASGAIEIVDCADNVVPAGGIPLVINPNMHCQCDVPTQDTTWGKLKALYAQ
jgi:hypothetical protein